MNAVEQIVELYFQKVRHCFTCSDIKIEKGNNRQFDLLAYSIKDNKQYHVESSVTHRLNWNPTLLWLIDKNEYKFFGKPRINKNKSKNTDNAKNKNYLNEIKKQYKKYGLDFEKMNRVWVLWCVDNLNINEYCQKDDRIYLKEKINRKNIELLSFRDEIIPKLEEIIGTSNYEDDIARTISLIIQYQRQKKRNNIKIKHE
jgi:hypothetical protein